MPKPFFRHFTAIGVPVPAFPPASSLRASLPAFSLALMLTLPACSGSRAADLTTPQARTAFIQTQSGAGKAFKGTAFSTEAFASQALETYHSSGHFKAAAANPQQILGAGVNALSLFKAEQKARTDCTKRSDYQGECETVLVGKQTLAGLSDDQKEQSRWRYMRLVHRQFGRRMPLRTGLRAKVLMPGSRVADAVLSLSKDYAQGGFVTLQMPGYTCTGTMDPIQGEEGEENANPIGVLEFACQSGQILRGGYAFLNPQNQLFFIEDRENERWDFIISSANKRVGYNTAAFKKLFYEIEEMD